MSYILDALKKAEAERHIGHIPGLHVQPAAALPAPTAPKHSNKLLLTIAAVLLGAGGVLAWLQPWQSPPTQSGPAAVAQPQTLASAGAPITPSAAMPLPAPQIVAISPPPEPPRPVVRKEPKRRPAATPPPPDTKKAAPAADTAMPRATQTAAAPARPATANDLKLSTALTPEAGVSSPGELPEKIQRELPTLAIGGYIYSDNPRERQLLVNKRLLHEGAEAAPGVKLEKMLPNAAVFNYKGYRYRLSY